MHPYIQSKAAQARTDELVRRAQSYRRADLLAPPMDPRQRPRWHRLRSLLTPRPQPERHNLPAPAPDATLMAAEPEPATCPAGAQTIR